jgi:prolyl-tRNA synthetase
LTEPLVIRPTSETIIGSAFARWVQSYRDLPLLINQWANVVRWEMRPRLFLRTSEFLWQEGHTAHETEQEAIGEAVQMLEVYAAFTRNHLALPVYHGEKTESERFPGAVQTLTVEAMVQDRKAIQAGTSHFLGQNFAKAAGIKYISRTGAEEHVWTTSWGASTRLIGTVIMTHADDDGMILPPRIAPSHVVILPITPKEETKQAVLQAAATLKEKIAAQRYADEPIRVEIDQRDVGGGAKNWEWIKRGVPIRIEIGPRDLSAGTVAVSRRDQPVKEKAFQSSAQIVDQLPAILGEIQKNLYDRAKLLRDSNTVRIDSRKDFYDFFTAKNSEKAEIHGGFALAHWSGSPEVEAQIKEELKVTIRCIPFDQDIRDDQPGQCVLSGEPSPRRVLFAKSY